jgi:hypothetical protein
LANPELAVPAASGFHALVDGEKVGIEAVEGVEGKIISADENDAGREEHEERLERDKRSNRLEGVRSAEGIGVIASG